MGLFSSLLFGVILFGFITLLASLMNEQEFSALLKSVSNLSIDQQRKVAAVLVVRVLLEDARVLAKISSIRREISNNQTETQRRRALFINGLLDRRSLLLQGLAFGLSVRKNRIRSKLFELHEKDVNSNFIPCSYTGYWDVFLVAFLLQYEYDFPFFTTRMIKQCLGAVFRSRSQSFVTKAIRRGVALGYFRRIDKAGVKASTTRNALRAVGRQNMYTVDYIGRKLHDQLNETVFKGMEDLTVIVEQIKKANEKK